MDRRVDYDKIAATYERRYDENEYSGTEHALLRFVGDAPDVRVLEVGCGTGHWLALLSRRGIRVAGLDASAQMLAGARSHAPDAALAQGRAEHLPWRDASFHRVVCINALHHFGDMPAFLQEARRVLRPGGAVMTVGLDPHTGVDQWCIYDYFEGTLEIDKRRYPPAERIRQWMSAAGFVECATAQVEHLRIRLLAREALDQGRLDKGVTSQLAVLTDEEYRRGIDRIRAEIESADARGESLYLTADLRLYATFGSVAPQ